MNGNWRVDFSLLTLVADLLLGVLIFGLLWLLHRWLRRRGNQGAIGQTLPRLMPMIEFLAWGGFIVYSLRIIFKNEVLFSIALFLWIIVGLIWLSWFVLRDWVAGFVIRIRDVYIVNAAVQIGDISGCIRRMGALSMDIESSDGEIMEVPYSRVTGQVRRTDSRYRQAGQRQLVVEVPRTQTTVAENSQHLKTVLLSAPWWAVNQIPQIQLSEETDTVYRYEIRLPVMNEANAARLVQYLAGQFSEVYIRRN